MTCIGATGAACTGANGEDCRDGWLEVTPAVDTVLSSTTGLTYIVTWTPVPNTVVRMQYRGASSGQMEVALVDGNLGTWTSPTVDLLDHQILLSRMEHATVKQYSLWNHLRIENIPFAVTHGDILVTHNLGAVIHE